MKVKLYWLAFLFLIFSCEIPIHHSSRNSSPKFSEVIENLNLSEDWLDVNSMIGISEPTVQEPNDVQAAFGHGSASPLVIYVIQVSQNKNDPERQGKVIMQVYLRTSRVRDMNYIKEKLKGFTVKRKIAQFALKGESFGIVIPPQGRNHKSQSEADINFNVEFNANKGRDWVLYLAEVVRESYHLFQEDSHKPALMRFAWEGTNSQGAPEILYTEPYRFDNRELLEDNYNMMRWFCQSNGLPWND